MTAVHANPDEQTRFKVPPGVSATDSIHQYILTVLQEALNRTALQYGPATLYSEPENLQQIRQFRSLEANLIDIAWAISSAERDSMATPVRIPVIGGLYGYRVLLVNVRDQRFIKPMSLNQIRTLSLVQGDDWPDTAILRANQFEVTGATYLAGFRLVQNQFVDAYPRGAHETLPEVESGVADGLSVAPHVLLIYPNPLFFYVSRSKPALAKRLESGLQKMVDDGSLQQLLEAQPFYQHTLALVQNKQIIELSNPLLAPASLNASISYLSDSELLQYISNVQKGKKEQDTAQAN